MLRGSITALITPFKDGAVDEKTFSAFVDWQIKEGSHGLVPMGTTGESPTVTHEEQRRVIEIAVEVAERRVPVVAGAGSNSTDEAISLTRFAEDIGADAVTAMPAASTRKRGAAAMNDVIAVAPLYRSATLA